MKITKQYHCILCNLTYTVPISTSHFSMAKSQPPSCINCGMSTKSLTDLINIIDETVEKLVQRLPVNPTPAEWSKEQVRKATEK